MKLKAFLKIMAYDDPPVFAALVLTAITLMASDPPLQVMLATATIIQWLITIWIAYKEGVRLGWDVE